MSDVKKKCDSRICAPSSVHKSGEQTEVKPTQVQRQQSVLRSSLITKAPTCTGGPDTVNTAVLFSEH